jgi:hypothetical protein
VACNALADEMDRLAKDQARAKATNAEIAKAINEGCPCCGAKIRRNMSLTGWWQCEQFGAVTHRKDPSKPACSWQAFFVDGVS